MARFNLLLTITAGTPIRLSDSATDGTQKTQPLYVNELIIQMASGGSGLGYVMAGVKPGTTPNKATAGTVSAQLTAATAGAPGGTYSDAADPRGGGGIDLSKIWIDGDHTADTVVVSWDSRV